MELCQPFFRVFTVPGATLFARLMGSWVLCTTRRTITGMIPFADPLGLKVHDAYHRFLPDARWGMSRLWHLQHRILVRRFCSMGIMPMVLDDTLFQHSGCKMGGAGTWRETVRSTANCIIYVWDLNLVVLTLPIQPPRGREPLGLPINMRLHRKKEQTLIDPAEQMINEARQWFPERRFRVVADGFSATLARKLLDKTTMTSRIRGGATLYDLPPKHKEKGRGRPRTCGRKLPKLEKMAAAIKAWKSVTSRQRGKTFKRLVYTPVVL